MPLKAHINVHTWASLIIDAISSVLEMQGKERCVLCAVSCVIIIPISGDVKTTIGGMQVQCLVYGARPRWYTLMGVVTAPYIKF